MLSLRLSLANWSLHFLVIFCTSFGRFVWENAVKFPTCTIGKGFSHERVIVSAHMVMWQNPQVRRAWLLHLPGEKSERQLALINSKVARWSIWNPPQQMRLTPGQTRPYKPSPRNNRTRRFDLIRAHGLVCPFGSFCWCVEAVRPSGTPLHGDLLHGSAGEGGWLP